MLATVKKIIHAILSVVMPQYKVRSESVQVLLEESLASDIATLHFIVAAPKDVVNQLEAILKTECYKLLMQTNKINTKLQVNQNE